MVKPQMVGEVPIGLAEAKAELERIKARDGTLNFRAAKCEEYLNDFATISVEKAAQLKKKIQDLGITRLKEENVIKVIDMLPKTPEDVKVIFQGSTVSISRKDMEQIAALVQDVVK